MNFFILGGPFCSDGSEFDFDGGDWTSVGDTPRCDTCGNAYAMLPFVPPIKGMLVADASVFDLSKTAGGDVLVSEACLHSFHDHGIHGLLEPHRIEFVGVDGPLDLKSVGTYFLGRVEWGAEIDRAASGLRTTQIQPCPRCGFAGSIEGYDRVAVVESSWDGRDLFSVKGLPGVVMVAERLRKLCNDLKLGVCALTPAEEYSTPWLPKSNH
jgi:hypothetical protein